MFLNTYLFKGSRFPGMKGLIGPLGQLGGSFYHTTLGEPDVYPMHWDQGLYTAMLINWQHDKDPTPVEYTMQVYSTGGKVTISY